MISGRGERKLIAETSDDIADLFLQASGHAEEAIWASDHATER